MSVFSELMKQPLPSALGYFKEDEDDTLDIAADAIDDEELDPDKIDEMEDDMADISDEELDQMEDDSAIGADGCDDDEDEVELDDEEEADADKYMSLSATPVVLKSDLTECDANEFAESVDFDIAVSEGFLLESFKDDLAGDDITELMTEAVRFAPKTKVMFSKEDRQKQLFWVGVFASARARNDRDYAKLQKAYRIERNLKARLKKKYSREALKRVKAYIQRLKKSKSGVLTKIADKITGKK